MKKNLFIAEKPSVAREFAKALKYRMSADRSFASRMPRRISSSVWESIQTLFRAFPVTCACSCEWKAVEGSRYFASPLLYKENGFQKKETAQELIQYLSRVRSRVSSQFFFV